MPVKATASNTNLGKSAIVFDNTWDFEYMFADFEKRLI
jgi:hypothetical protein